MDFKILCKERRTERVFEPNVDISDTDLMTIFQLVSNTPSAFNLQHWRFIITRQEAIKANLFELCYFQQQVIDCSAVITICGNLSAHLEAESIYKDQPAAVRKKFIPMINLIYSSDGSLQRDEVMRSGGLISMSLMYAAQNEGWATGPMVGFDVAKVSSLFNLDENIIPVMMLTIGKSGNALEPRPFRHDVNDLLHYETYKNTAM